MRSFVATWILLVSLVCAASSARAQCDCDHTLEVGTTVAIGDELGVGPGDRVCVTSGTRPFLRLQQFHGTEAEPITVLNCGGVVEITNPDRAYALVIEGTSSHVRVTGSGVEGVEHGFRVSAPAREPYPGIGVWILGRATNIEVDHMEVFDTGFAGVMAKTDPACEDRPFWDGFVMRDTHLHHLWVHDTGGEGFYIGSTQLMGYTRSCDGADVVIPPHRLDGVAVDHVLVEDTGWDGIQFGVSDACVFSDSVVRRVGLEGVEFQMQGVQVGSSRCELRRLDVRDGGASGVFVLDSSDVTIADSVIAGFAADAIYLNLRSAPAGTWTIVHNTITGSASAGARGFGDGVTGRVANNLVFGNAMGDLQLPRSLESVTNLELADAAAAGVVSADDLHLGASSPARGAGTDLTAMGYAVDLDGRLRASPPSVGAYEHASDTPDAGVAIDAAVAPPLGSDAGRLERDAAAVADGGPSVPSAGCSCRLARRDGGSTLPFTLGLALFVVAICRRSRARNHAPHRRAETRTASARQKY